MRIKAAELEGVLGPAPRTEFQEREKNGGVSQPPRKSRTYAALLLRRVILRPHYARRRRLAKGEMLGSSDAALMRNDHS
jgi:hypothetical protein